MASMLPRLFAWSSSIVPLLLCCCTGPGFCKGIDPHGVDTVERTSLTQRKLQDDGQGSLTVADILDKQLLANPINVLPARTRIINGMYYDIRDMDLLFNETTNDSAVYYVDLVIYPASSGATLQSSTVKRAEKRSFSSTEYSISHIVEALPVIDSPYALNATDSTAIWGLAILDANSLVFSDTDNSLLRKVNIATGNLEGMITSHRAPRRIAKHPTQPNILFVSTVDRIFSIRLDSPTASNVREIVGPTMPALDWGHNESQTDRAEGLFDVPYIGPQAVSRDGSILYVADAKYHMVKRVNTVTGATKIVAGISNSGDRDGLVSVAKFNRPVAVAVTSDGCNLFVADFGGGAVRWLPLQQPHGDVIEVKTIVTVKNTDDNSSGIFCVVLSRDEQFLFAGTKGGQILKFELNTSALHRCSSSSSISSSQPSPAPAPQSQNGVPSPSSSSPPSSTSPSPQSQREVPSPMASSSSSSSLVNSSGNSAALTIGLAVGLTALMLGTCGCIIAAMVMYRKRPSTAELPRRGRNSVTVSLTGKKGSQSVSLSDGRGSRSSPKHPVAVHGIREFTQSEIREALENGHCLTGKGGGYGDVYRGSLMVGGTNMDVAIKVMRGEFDESKYKQFIAEVSTLSQVRHKNLCRLVGYCTDEASCVLVYPFIEGGSLHDLLHNAQGPPGGGERLQGPRTASDDEIMWLDWRERVTVAKQVATCLRYLHHELEPPIMHRDIKSRNLLVTGKGKHLQACLIDFGLSRSGNPLHDGQTISSRLTVPTVTRSGTPGYMAPEYMYGSYLTMMNDTFSFGVVLLELITGRKAVMRVDSGVQLFLYVWARQWLSLDNLTRQQLEEITDPVLVPSLTTEEWEMVSKLAKLAHRCTADVAVDRPSMKEVLDQINVLQ